jgi:cytochrome P450
VGNWGTGSDVIDSTGSDVIDSPRMRKPSCLRTGLNQLLLVSDADAVKQILVTNSFKYHRPSVGGKLLSHKNVVRANGKEHSRMRKMLNPAFKVNTLKSMVDVFHEKAKLLKKVN